MSQPHYRMRKALTRTLRVCYPAGKGDIVLRTDQDWDRDVAPISVSEDGTCWTFSITCHRPFLYFKPCLRQGGASHWSVGANLLLLMSESDIEPCYPYFFGPIDGHASRLYTLPSPLLGREHKVRAYLPPGYDENTLASYPVTFVQDGQNLFFPEEAFLGQDWQVGETSQLLHMMSAAADRILIGIHSADRMVEYTKPGYERYARSLVEELLPEVSRRLRIAEGRGSRTLMGSSLGGVVAFYTAWQYPEVFGRASCMSSTFSYKDDLIERVLSEEPRDVGFYLDSGWPGDNYEVTAAMAVALISRGWEYGRNLFYLTFPMAEHNESSWGNRLHLPFQMGFGAVARYSRAKAREAHPMQSLAAPG